MKRNPVFTFLVYAVYIGCIIWMVAGLVTTGKFLPLPTIIAVFSTPLFIFYLLNKDTSLKWYRRLVLVLISVISVVVLMRTLPHWSTLSDSDRLAGLVVCVVAFVLVPLMLWSDITGISLKRRWREWRG